MTYTDNVLSYLKWRGDLSFRESPFNEVDALILSMISYVDFHEIVPPAGVYSNVTIHQAYQKAKERLKESSHSDVLFEAMAQTTRFGGLILSDYSHIVNTDLVMQFGAVRIQLNSFCSFISFEGTEDELVGWREDMRMTYMMPVPSQSAAVDYLNRVMHGWFHKYLIGGHSKGGNLAKYASCFCQPKLQKKIVNIYSFDGPGFSTNMSTNPCYLNISDFIHSYCPQDSVIGMLMHHSEPVILTESQDFEIGQHNLLSWSIDGTSIVRAKNRTHYSYLAEATISNWMDKFTLEERDYFVNLFFDVVENAGIKTFPELMSMKFKTIAALLMAMKDISSEDRNIILRAFKLLLDERSKAKKN